MMKIYQTVFGAPGGNCLSACVASLLHVSILDVPYFGGDDEWFDSLRQWLMPRGLYPVNAMLSAKHGAWRPDGFYILAGPSPRGGFLHAVVARGREIVHDPHPSEDGLLGHTDATILVPLDPQQAAKAVATLTRAQINSMR